MKRKLALLMAAVMTLTMLPAMNIFGATGQALSVTPNVVPKKSVLYEQGVYQATTRAKSGPIRGVGVDSDIEYAVDGTDLILTCYNDVKVGDTFRISLENAKFFARGNYRNAAGNIADTVAANRAVLIDAANTATTSPTGTALSVTGFGGTSWTEKWSVSTMIGDVFGDPNWGALFNNYDPQKGLWWPTGANTSAVTGTYVRFGDIASLTSTTTGTYRDDYNAKLAMLNAARQYLLDYVAAGAAAGPTLADADNDTSAIGAGWVPSTPTYIGQLFPTWTGATSTYNPIGGTGAGGAAGSGLTAADTAATIATYIAAITAPTMPAYEIDRLATIPMTGVAGVLDTTAFAKAVNATSGKPASIPYILQMDASTDQEAVVTVLNIFPGQTTNDLYRKGDYWEFRIPMIVRTTETGDVKVNIFANTAPVTTGTISLFSQTVSGVSTKTYADEYVTARTDFALKDIIIKETRLHSIANSTYTSQTDVGLDRNLGKDSVGTFTLQAPSGFEWKDPNELKRDTPQRVWAPADRVVNIGVESGLAWQITLNTGTGATGAGRNNRVVATTPLVANSLGAAPMGSASGKWFGLGYSGTYNNGGVLGGIFGNYNTIDRDSYSAPYSLSVNGTGGPAVTPHNDYRIFFKNQGLTTEDRSILVVELYNLQPSTDLMGKLYIQGLGLIADETAKIGDVLINIKDDRRWPAGVSDEVFKVAVRAEWDIILKTISDIPTLVNGRYNKVDPLQAYDKDHKTARVQFEEQSLNAWWSDRKTEFILPEWAKFRMVDFLNDEFTDNRLQQASINVLYNTVYTSNLPTTASREGNIGKGIYINDNVKHGAVTINGNVMTLENLKVQTDQRRAKLVMDMWISIESGKTGDVQLSVAGSAIPVQSNGGGVAPVTIARSVNPINVTTKVTDIKIGYQYQPTFDVLITETAPAMLEKGKDVYVSVSDLMSTDMLFSPDTKVAVTGGNLKIKSINNAIAVGPINVAKGATVLAGTGGTVTFNVDMASSVASTITISNASVKIDRTVPETNKYPYKVIAWGPAVAPNYVYYEYNKDVRDKFPTAGIMADYLKVISSANDKSSILTQEVHVTIGETFFTVNGVSYDMDAAAYISTASNSTMVPVRFIANAFGISNEQVIWDESKRTVTVVLPSRVIQFTVDSSTMLLDGSAVTMYSPDNLEVMAEIVGDRCYVPFRAMGEAFGVKVEWDDATQTAIYNPGAYSGAVAADAAEETTATTAQ